jgi:YesN/AraC family two-component response regulator
MKRILLASQDPEDHEQLTRACAHLGHVLWVSTARQVQSACATRAVDIVVLEQRLPDRSGLDLLAALKARSPRLPVIMATAWGSERVCAAALKLGVRDYFIKPWSPVDMAASIRAILGVTGRPREERRNVLEAPPEVPRRLVTVRRGVTVVIRRAAQRIKDDVSEPVSFGQLARELRLSKPALSRRFRRTIGVSYRRLVNDARIERARQLLTSSDHTVTEIALLVGFGDLPRFDKVFKAVMGASPSVYRSNSRQAGETSY